jgi:hypothetical protein
VQYGLPLAESVPLLAALLSLPLTADYAPLTLSPEQQKQKTLHALLTIMLRIAAQQPVLFVMEDLHWVDPSTLEFLTLLVDQGPTVRILTLLTCRPDFSPPWTGRSPVTQVTLLRLPRRQAAEMADRVAHGKALPPEVVEQVVAKTDGVPLFVEELTQMVLESGLLQEQDERYDLTGPLPPLAIPTTLHDSLMARLDRLATVKGLVQLGATLGREFSYDLLQAVSPWEDETLRRGLHQLVAAEFLYQHGLPPQATYRFKHALIQDAAYQSLLRSTRQQYHHRMAQVVEARFPEVCETQPELIALHNPQQMRDHAVRYGQECGVFCHLLGAMTLWLLGYPDQARQWSEAALTQAQRLRHAYTLDQALCFSALLHLWRQEAAVAQELAEAQRAPCTEHGFTVYLAWGTIEWGSALAAQGEWAEGLAQMREGLGAYRARARTPELLFLGLLAETYGRAGQVEEGRVRCTRRWRPCRPRRNACMRPRCIGSRASCCARALSSMKRRRKPAFIKPSTWLAASKRNCWSCAQP